jgi:hypothetical protein
MYRTRVMLFTATSEMQASLSELANRSLCDFLILSPIKWVAGPPIAHGQGLCQRDPLSPLLFDIGIDPIQQVLDLATSHGLLRRVQGCDPILRTSPYVDDGAVFLAPIKEDIRNLASIVNAFGELTGLFTNFQKISVVPIRCGEIDLMAFLRASRF